MFAAAILWGLWWIPIRGLEAAGMAEMWAGFSMILGAFPLLVIIAVAMRAPLSLSPRAALGAAMVGLAMTSYAGAIVFTDVVRAVLLFYLAPAWSILIECLFFGRRFSAASGGAIAASLLGGLVIFRGEIALDQWSIGDGLALGSGVLWAVGAAIVFTRPAASATLALYCGGGALLGAAGFLALGGAAMGAPPSWPEAWDAAPLALGSGVLYLAPIVLATMWGAQRLTPAILSFLLTAEILSGVGSSALLLDERFGLIEALGAALVIGGALVEVARQTSGPAAPMDANRPAP